MLQTLQYIFSRLKEPSSSAGLGLILVAAHNNDLWGLTIALAGLAGIVIPEGKKK